MIQVPDHPKSKQLPLSSHSPRYIMHDLFICISLIPNGATLNPQNPHECEIKMTTATGRKISYIPEPPHSAAPPAGE